MQDALTPVRLLRYNSLHIPWGEPILERILQVG